MATNRPEDAAYGALLAARLAKADEWPEPETTDFYKALRLGALHIIAQTLHRRERDLASEIATRTLLRLRSFRGQSEFSTWFYRIVRNAITSWVRSEARKNEVQISIVPEIEVPPPSMTIGLHIPELTREQIELLERVTAGENFETIAKTMGYATRQMAARRWRALRKFLQEHGKMYTRGVKP